VASALIAFLSDFSAGVSLLRVFFVSVHRFVASIDLSSDLVDAIVDADFMDMASCSEMAFMLARCDECIVVVALCSTMVLNIVRILPVLRD